MDSRGKTWLKIIGAAALVLYHFAALDEVRSSADRAAANAAVAAKLRQLQPRLEARLQEQGLQPSRVRIKVQG